MDAIVRPLAVAICTSDVHTLWEGAIVERHNMILGHEACGVVDEVGELVRDFKPGDKVLEMTDGKGVDRVIVAGGGCQTFEDAVKALKPGGKIGNVNYLGGGDFVTIPRVEWGVGMGHKDIRGGLMPGGRLRMEKLGALVSSGRLDVAPLSTHVFHGWDHLEEALFLMRDKPADLIKPVVVID